MRISDWSSDVGSSDLPSNLLPTKAVEVTRLPCQLSIPLCLKCYQPYGLGLNPLSSSEPNARSPSNNASRPSALARCSALSSSPLSHVTNSDALGVCAPSSSSVSCLASRRRRSRCSTRPNTRSEEHTSELQSLMRISYAVFCLKNK